MGGVVARKIIVEVEVPEGKSLEEVLKGVKYRVIEEDRREKRKRVLERYAGILGEASAEELDEIAEEVWNT